MTFAPSKVIVLGAVLASLLLSGCATPPGGASSTASKLLGAVGASDVTDVFSSRIRALKQLVADSKFDEADALFRREQAYFRERYISASEVAPEIAKLGAYVWGRRYQMPTDQVLSDLRAITRLPDANSWAAASKALHASATLSDTIALDVLMQVARLGGPQRSALSDARTRVTTLAYAARATALATSYDGVLQVGTHDAAYVGDDRFTTADYVASTSFQERAYQHLRAVPDRAGCAKKAAALSPYLSPQTKALVDAHFVDRVREELLADGRISLEEVSSLAGATTPFGGAAESLRKLVSIGYVDLTSASFKDRNAFDFPISFKQDLALEFRPAGESVFSSQDISRFDFVFVTDLAVAKVTRQFKSKKEITSRVLTGTREVPNSDYVTAMTGYQKAMADYQRVQVQTANPGPCAGLSCIAIGITNGLLAGAARQDVEKASSRLARTSQTLSVPVYTGYQYQSVEVDTAKAADVNYYIIDVKRKQILSSSFQAKDREVFNVAYNLRDEDPEKDSILRASKPEAEVTAWEKSPMTVSLAALFNDTNIRAATAAPYKDLQAFLRKLDTRQYASAKPSYSQGGEESPGRTSGQTVADARFDSIVMLRNAKSLGTGFYVTPELILTAFHVVNGSSLVEVTFYDGTKTYGKVIDHDVRLDLALVKAQSAGKPLKIYSGPIKLGETVEAIGHPQGFEFTITRGIVSALRKQKSLVIRSDNLVEFLQTDTSISQGNSGGPLLLKDAVVGVVDWMRVDKGSQSLNFSVSYNELRAYLDRFMDK